MLSKGHPQENVLSVEELFILACKNITDCNLSNVGFIINLTNLANFRLHNVSEKKKKVFEQ